MKNGGLPHIWPLSLHKPRAELYRGRPGARLNQVLISSIKVEVKKKHISDGWTFSCFAAHLIEQDLFWPSALGARSLGNVAQWLGFSFPVVFIASSQRSRSVPKPAKQTAVKFGDHSSIRDSWPIAFSGYPRGPRVGCETRCPKHAAPN